MDSKLGQLARAEAKLKLSRHLTIYKEPEKKNPFLHGCFMLDPLNQIKTLGKDKGVELDFKC